MYRIFFIYLFLASILINSLKYGCTEEALSICSMISVQHIIREQPKSQEGGRKWKEAIHTLSVYIYNSYYFIYNRVKMVI